MRLLPTSTSKQIETKSELTKKVRSSYSFEFDILSEAIPYIKHYEGQTMVISFDEALLEDFNKMNSFASDIILLKNSGINPIIVHDAEQNIKKYMAKFNMPYDENEKISVTLTNIDVVEMVSLLVNKKIVTAINNAGGLAIGISGKDGKLIEAKKVKAQLKKIDDNNAVLSASLEGEPIAINPDILTNFEESDFIPVISSIGFNDSNHSIYVSADEVASMISSSLAASKIIFMTSEDYFKSSEEGAIVDEISSIQVRNLIHKFENKGERQKIISGLKAIDNYTESAHFLNSSVEHGLIFEVLSDNRPGTMIYPTNI